MTPPHLFNRATLADYRTSIDAAADVLDAAVREVSQPVRSAAPAALSAELAEIDLDTPAPTLQAALDETRQLYLDRAVWFHEPTYAAHLNPPVAVPALAADVIASAVNTSVDTWDQSQSATLIEMRLIAWLTNKLGLPETAGGIFTSGGTASNQQALLLARDRCLDAGADLRTLRFLCTSQSHFSVHKAAHVLGLGKDAVVHIPTDRHGRLSPIAADRVITDLQKQGLVPAAIVATAGTTDRGAIDPLDAVARLARHHGVWMHVDAAIGGAWITSDRARGWLTGIELADSVTVDFHKTWYQPLAASAVLVRTDGELRRCGLHADYLNPAHYPEPNLVDKSLQTSRRFDALKLWLTLRTLGAQTIGQWVDASLENAQRAYQIAQRTPDVEVLEEPTSHMLLLRFAPKGHPADAPTLNVVNDSIRARMFAAGEHLVARTVIAGTVWLKLTLLNPETGDEFLRQIIAAITSTGHTLTTTTEALA